MYGPVEGRRHNLTILRCSGWNEENQQHLTTTTRQYYIYGDSAYSLRPCLQRSFVGNVTNEEKAFNMAMSSVCIYVEHSYKDIKRQWTSQDFCRNLKIGKAPIGLLYLASALLTNLREIFYSGGKVQEIFQTLPASFEVDISHLLQSSSKSLQ